MAQRHDLSRLPAEATRFAARLLRLPALRIVGRYGEFAGKLTVFIAALTWILQYPARIAEENRSAWQVLSLAHGQPGAGGRVEALDVLRTHGVNLEGLDLHGAFLEHVDLRGLHLENSKFVSAKIAYGRFDRSFLDYADFGRADGNKPLPIPADGTTGQGWPVSFRNARIQEANFEDGQFDGADFSVDSQLRQYDVSKPESPQSRGIPQRMTTDRVLPVILDSHFDGASLMSAKFVGTTIQSSTFTNGSKLSQAHFERAMLIDTTFETADLEEVSFQNSVLWNANFRCASLANASFQHSTLIDPIFEGADVQGADFSEARITTLLPDDSNHKFLSHIFLARNIVDARLPPIIATQLKHFDKRRNSPPVCASPRT